MQMIVFSPPTGDVQWDFPCSRLGAAWDLLMRGEGIELPREQALMEPQREMTYLGCAKKNRGKRIETNKQHTHIFMI